MVIDGPMSSTARLMMYFSTETYLPNKKHPSDNKNK